MERYIMALDQGTTSSRCIIFDRGGRIASVAQKEFRQIYPAPGWVEHDPEEIRAAQMGVAMEAMQKLGLQPEQIAAIGITNQRETTIVWDAATGKPVYNAIVWQCRRTADRIEKLKADGWEEKIRMRTGLVPDAYFSASKIAWILDNVPGVRARAEAGELRFGTVDSWLIWNLTGGRLHVTDYTNASRTMLFDIHRLCWDEEILEYFRIPASILPEVRPSSEVYGYTTLFGGTIPVAGAAGDQQAALFGQCGFRAGRAKMTYGTGGFMLLNTGENAVRADNGLLTTIAACASGDGKPAKIQYALEGSVFVAGAAVQWLRDELEILRSAPESEDWCRAVEDAGNVYVVPSFTGMGAPYWNPYARGAVFGLTRGASRAHLIRATVESIAYQTEDLLCAMREAAGNAKAAAGFEIESMQVDGGASANNFLMQFQADISHLTIRRPVCIETTALGAAYLAGLAVGFWKDTADIEKNWSCDREFMPQMEENERRQHWQGWKRAVRAALCWAEGSET